MIRRLLPAIVLCIFIYGKAWSQATITAQAFAEIIEALTANETDQLNFGRFSPESGGIITISPDGTRTVQGSIFLAIGTYNPGRFNVTGSPGATFTLQLPDGPVLLVHQNSNRTMQVFDWVSDPPASSTINLSPNGSRLISIGASLAVGTIDQNPVGLYAGTFQLTIAYN